MEKETTALKEACGILGVYRDEETETAALMYAGLYALQHRGQEGCGITVNDFDNFTTQKDVGLVSEVLDASVWERLQGYVAIGHTLYSTTGSNTRENVQPLVVRYSKGMLAIALNGNLVNAYSLRADLQAEGIAFQTTSDAEVLAFLISKERAHTKSVEEAIAAVVPKLKGSFSFLVMSPKKLIAVRDPYGIRPLCIGKRDDGIVFASETCALPAMRAKFVCDLRPGEIVVAKGAHEELQHITANCPADDRHSALCIFEHIYFARPDSVIDGQSVYAARYRAGEKLAEQHPVDADLVIAVPDSAIAAATGYAAKSGIPYGEGLIKNRYIGRTFIQPSQAMREASVNIKLAALEANVRGKRIVLVDDSIVRGTTTEHLVFLLKEAGATEVHVRISSPPFLWPCYFGVDVPRRDQLAACIYTHEELRCKINADSLEFLKLEGIEQIAKDSKLRFCTACFDGNYPFEIPDAADKETFELPFYRGNGKTEA